MTHSLGGGTGSGLGSRLLLWIRDSFPLINLLAVSCGGFAQESPVQNYNAVLALDKLQALCDGIVLFNNEHIVENLRNNKSSKQTASAASSTSTPSFVLASATPPTTSLTDLNAEICLSLHGAFLPTSSLNAGCGNGAGNNNLGGAFKLKSGAGVSFNMEPLELIRTLTPMPSHKILQMDTITQSKETSGLNVAQSLCRALKRPWSLGGEEDATEKEKVRHEVLNCC